ncbi:MAG: helicase HerA-like domain-containing protein [Acetatifactor sp.]
MYKDGKIYIGLADGQKVCMELNMCNRHGLIAGASGTGKTITMKAMAESFSDAGVPVFLCDIKGDVSGLASPGVPSESMEKRIDKFGIRKEFSYKAYPTCFWDIYQEKGHPVRATVSDMGPELLSRILGLTPAQEGVLNIVFRIADDKGLILVDLKDLKAVLNYVSENRKDYLTTYGNVTPQSIGGVIRALIPLESQGGDLFFGEPALDIFDWMRTDSEGKGMINILHSVKLAQNPTLYASFLLWMMAELFERLPEAGDLEKPKLVFFFDEAHMLFSDAPRVLVQKIEQVVKLIRSKGVGIYFVTQSPSDIPDGVLAQLSNRVQHALRAYTPAEQKAVRVAAQSFRANPAFKTEDVIMELGVGHALTSFLDENGVPGVVQQTAIICPQSFMGPVDEGVRSRLMASDGMDKYNQYVDNWTAYEVLTDMAEAAEKEAALEAERQQLAKEREEFEKQKEKEAFLAQKQKEKEAEAARKKKEKEQEAAEKKREKAAERRKAQIERTLINTGAQVLKRGLFNTLFK